MPTPQAMVPLNVLVVEDSPFDAELLLAELKRGGYVVRPVVTCDERSMRAALVGGSFDIVICDYNMPQFDAIRALGVFRELALDIPFIVVSGTIGEDKAVEVMRHGAHDYIMKDRMKRLLPSVSRELKVAASRREQLRMSSALNASEKGRAMLLNVLDNAADPIGVFHPDLRIMYLNAACRKILGIAAEEPAATAALEAHYPEWAKAKIFAEAIPTAERTGHWQGETTVRSRSQKETPVWQVIGAHRDAEGNIDYLYTIIRDLTEQKALQAKLMLADRMASVGVLAASIAHEINNPLTYLDGYVDRALGSVRLEAKQRPVETRELLTSLTHAKEGVSRVKGIAHDLKLFFGAQTEAATTEPVLLNDILDSALKMAAFETRHRATINREYHATTRVDAHEGRLGQVFLNLLINAAHAIKEGSASTNRITVRTLDAPNGRVAIELEDTGSGIAPDALGRIFEPFFTTKAIGIGTGLGLFVCRDILAKYGGTIAVQSVVGVGTTFRIELPLSANVAPRADAATSTEATLAAIPANGRVLIVDDEPAIVEFLCCVLEPGCVVRQASGGDQAIDILRREPPFDVIISDVMMRDGTGIKLYETLRKEQPGVEKRIVFMTGGAPTPEAQRFLETVPNPQISKPFDVRELVGLVARMCE